MNHKLSRHQLAIIHRIAWRLPYSERDGFVAAVQQRLGEEPTDLAIECMAFIALGLAPPLQRSAKAGIGGRPAGATGVAPRSEFRIAAPSKRAARPPAIDGGA